MKNRFLNVRILDHATQDPPQQVIREKRSSIRTKFRAFKGSMKVIARIELEFIEINIDQGDAGNRIINRTFAYISIITPPIIFRQTDNINKFILSVEKAIDEEYERLNIPSTKFIFNRTLSINLNIARFTPISGSSYIPTPKFIGDKKATVILKI